jgi:hypothetical protein
MPLGGFCGDDSGLSSTLSPGTKSDPHILAALQRYTLEKRVTGKSKQDYSDFSIQFVQTAL